jgi:hypothetical protein
LKILKNKSVLLIAIPFLSIQFAYSQISIGGSFGIQIPGRQDLKFKKYNSQNQLIETIKTAYVQSNISAVENIHLTYWKNKFGARLEYLNWEHNSVAKQYLTSELPEFNSTEQSRQAIYFNVLYRHHFPFKYDNENNYKNGYSFLGVGYGGALTEIDKGLQKNIRSAIQLNYGISFPITKRLSALAEFKYLLTRDADNTSGPEGATVVDTSGHWTLFRLGPHIDTKYHVILFGLKWNILK